MRVAPRLSSVDAEMSLSAIFETKYGIFNHTNPDLRKARPLALVALHEAEDLTRSAQLYTQLENYIKLDIYKHTGLSMTEFFELPRDLVNHIYNVAAEKQAVESRVVDNLNQTLSKKVAPMTEREANALLQTGKAH